MLLHSHLAEEVGREVLVDAQRSPLLGDAGESDRGRELRVGTNVSFRDELALPLLEKLGLGRQFEPWARQGPRPMRDCDRA